MRICSTAALEILLAITALHIYIQKQAISSVLGLSSFKALKLEDIRGDLEIFEGPNINQPIHIAKDRIPM